MPKARQMPKEGFYVLKSEFEVEPGDIDIIYTTGIAGKGGHMYYRKLFGEDWGWSTLMWTHVPSIKDAEDNYIYYKNEKDLPHGIPKKPRKN